MWRPRDHVDESAAIFMSPQSGLPERREVNYAVGEHAERYRRIMRVFLLNKTRDIGWQLSPADVQSRLASEFGVRLDDDVLDRCLERLAEDGDLAARADTRAVSSAAEWRRKRSVYDITPAGERVEQLLAELDALGEEIGALESGRLLAIRDALARIAAGLREHRRPALARRRSPDVWATISKRLPTRFPRSARGRPTS